MRGWKKIFHANGNQKKAGVAILISDKIDFKIKDIPFMIKTLQKVGIEGTYLNIIKAIFDKPTTNIVLNGEKLKAFALRSGIRQGVHYHNFFQPCIGGCTIRQEKAIKGS